MSEDLFSDSSKEKFYKNKEEFGFDPKDPIISRKTPGPRPDHLQSRKRNNDIDPKEAARKREYEKKYAYSPSRMQRAASFIEEELGPPKQRKKKPPKGAKKPKKKKKFTWLYILIALLILGIGVFAYIWNGNFFKNDTDAGKAGLDDTIGGADPDFINILFVGIDNDEGRETNQLTDTILVASLDVKQSKLNVLQIPRDTYIGETYNPTGKINALYASDNQEYSGIDGLSKFIYDKMDIPVDHYATVTMGGFRKLIDDIGGVTVDVPYPINLDGVKLKAGTQTLDGNETEKFVRQRHGQGYSGGDIDRLKVQRIFMASLVNQILSTGKLKLISAMPDVAKEMSTDLSIGQMTDLINKMSSVSQDQITFNLVPGESAYVDTKAYGEQSVYSIHKDVFCELINSGFRAGLDPIQSSDIGLPEIANTTSYLDDVGGNVNDIIDQGESSKRSSFTSSSSIGSSSKSSSSKKSTN